MCYDKGKKVAWMIGINKIIFNILITDDEMMDLIYYFGLIYFEKNDLP